LLAWEAAMSVARITEISSTSPKSFEDAIVKGIERSNETLRNVKGAWVKDQEAMIEDGKPIAFKVILKVTLVLDN
jgi:dodecin